MRIGLGFQALLYAFTLRTDWSFLFAGDGGGMISRELSEAILDLKSPLIPRLGWWVRAGSFFHLEETTILYLLWALLLGASVCLLVGFFCRSAAIATWFLYLSAVKSGHLFSYGMDNFTLIGLFYLMIAPLPDRWSLDWWRGQRPLVDPTRLGFHLRVLQIHLCLIYFFGGISKAVGWGWWNGVSLWRALTGPPFDLIPEHFLVSLRALLPVAGIVVCLIEMGYPVFIWGRKTRAFWLGSVIAIHLGIGITMGLYLFSWVMIVLNLAGFGSELPWPRRRRVPLPAHAG